MSKDGFLRIASRPSGFVVHKYRWSHDNLRRQARRYYKLGLLTYQVSHDSIVYHTKKMQSTQLTQSNDVVHDVCMARSEV